MKHLIVNVDDFGIHEAVNAAVEESYRRGVVTSASLMAVGARFHQAVEIAKRCPGLGVGIHLSYTGERPAAPVDKIPSLVDRTGRLLEDHRRLCLGILRKRIPVQQVVWETEAQIRRVLDSGLRPTHVDSHRHLHLWPPLFRAIQPILQRYRLTTLRWLNLPWFEYRRLSPRKLAYVLWSQRTKRWMDGVYRHPDHFIGLARSGNVDAGYLRAALRRLPAGVTELSLHPAVDQAAMERDYGFWKTAHGWPCRWLQEYQAVLDPDVKRVIDREGIELINYAQLN